MFCFLYQRNGNIAVIMITIPQYLTILLVKCIFTKQHNPCINPMLTLNILSRSGSPIHLNALIPFIIHQIIITNWTLCWAYKNNNNNNNQALKCAPGGHHHHATKITTIHFTWNSWPQTRLKCSPIWIKPPRSYNLIREICYILVWSIFFVVQPKHNCFTSPILTFRSRSSGVVAFPVHLLGKLQYYYYYCMDSSSPVIRRFPFYCQGGGGEKISWIRNTTTALTINDASPAACQSHFPLLFLAVLSIAQARPRSVAITNSFHRRCCFLLLLLLKLL